MAVLPTELKKKKKYRGKTDQHAVVMCTIVFCLTVALVREANATGSTTEEG